MNDRLYRLNEDIDDYESVWEKPLIEEIDMVLNCNFDDYETDITLSEETKSQIAYDIINYEDKLWEDLHIIVLERVKSALVERYRYLISKEKTCGLDKEEKYELETLKYTGTGEDLK